MPVRPYGAINPGGGRSRGRHGRKGRRQPRAALDLGDSAENIGRAGCKATRPAYIFHICWFPTLQAEPAPGR